MAHPQRREHALLHQFRVRLSRGLLREDILGEKILSAIVEIKTPLEQVPAVLSRIKELGREVDTVISVGVSTRCDAEGNDALREILEREGYPVYRGKTNLGLGRASRGLPAVNQHN